MTKSSLLTMFGRLPTHQRPTQPPVATTPTTIGEPVLTQTSNERLSGHVGGARPRTSPYERLAATDFAKGLPQIPSCTFDDVEEAVVKDKGAEPSPPAPRMDPRDRSHSQSSPAPYHHPRLRNYNIVRKPAPPLPPPPPATVPSPAALGTAGGGNGGGGGGGGYGGINNTGSTSGGEDHASNARGFMSTSKGGGFTLGNLVKERMGRRPKLAASAHAHPAGAPGDRLLPDDDDDNDLLAPTAIRPVGLNSIDDWLDSRQSLHKRSATASSKSTQFTVAVAPSPELTIRHSTFAPLRAPPHLLPSGASNPPQPPPSPPPTMPIIPAFFKAKSLPPVPPVPPRPPPPPAPPRQSPLPGETGTGSYSDRPLPPIMTPESPLHRHHPVQRQQREQHRQQQQLLLQQQPPPPPPPPQQQQQQQQQQQDQKQQQQQEQQQPLQQQQQQQGPRDHLSQLEDEQQQLDSQKTRLMREIYEVEGKMGSSRAAREQFRPQLDELQIQYADVEKASHELGLKLCRAYRRRDLRAGIEGPTHLWVSRVTAPLEE